MLTRFTHARSTLTLLGLAGALVPAATAQASPAPAAAASGTVRLNAGGPALTDRDGHAWTGDRYGSGGWSSTSREKVEGTTGPSPFTTVRPGVTAYDVPVADGTYRVTLGFVENWWRGKGARVFSVSAEGTRVVDSLDIFRGVGRYRMLEQSFSVRVSDGALSLRFSAAADRPTLSALTVEPASTPPVNRPAPPAPAGCTSTLARGASLSGFLNALPAGAVGCLPEGTYTGSNVEMTRSGTSDRRITVRSVPGQTATLRMRLAVSSDYVTFTGLRFDTAHALGTSNTYVKSGANDVTFQGNEFASSGLRGTSAHDGQCLYSEAGTRDVKILGNTFRDCGSMEHFHHAMYVNGSRYTIANNLVLGTKAFGIHLYPELDDSLVTNNTVQGSGRAGIIVAEGSHGNRVVNNVLTNNARGGVTGYDTRGSNLVSNNLCWDNGGACVQAGQGFTGSGNVEADPRYLDAGRGNYRVAAGSPAVGTGDSAALGPDRDGTARPQGGAPDKGAYER